MIVPVLRVADVTASLAFYVHNLGFQPETVTWDRGGRPVFALLSRGANQLAIAAQDEAGANVTLLLDLDDEKSLRAICAHLRSQGLPLREDQPTRAFRLLDPDGHTLAFIHRAPRGRQRYAPEDRLL